MSTKPKVMGYFLGGEEPPRVMLTIARLVPNASDAFPADEFEERIRRYQALVEANKPMPLFGLEQPDVSEPVLNAKLEMECWACGRIERREGFVCLKREGALNPDDPRRWHSRMIGSSTTETYCPRCFDIWGWPDELEAILAAVEGVAAILADGTPGTRVNTPCVDKVGSGIS